MKKKYVSLACDRNGKMSTDIKDKGVVLTRRDYSKFVKKIYAHVVKQIFDREPKEIVLKYVFESIDRLFKGEYDLPDFIVTKSIGDLSGYKLRDVKKIIERITEVYNPNENDEKKIIQEFIEYARDKDKGDTIKELYDFVISKFVPQIQLAERMRRRGDIVEPGERLEYVITDNEGHKSKQGVKWESYEYFLKHRDILRLDYLDYLKSLGGQLDQILRVCYNIKEHPLIDEYKRRWNEQKITVRFIGEKNEKKEREKREKQVSIDPNYNGDLNALTVVQLKELIKAKNMKGYSRCKKQELINMLMN